jgi:hypothetical protein
MIVRANNIFPQNWKKSDCSMAPAHIHEKTFGYLCQKMRKMELVQVTATARLNSDKVGNLSMAILRVFYIHPLTTPHRATILLMGGVYTHFKHEHTRTAIDVDHDAAMRRVQCIN